MFLEEGSNVKNFEKKWKYYFQMIWTQLITPATQSGGVRSTLMYKYMLGAPLWHCIIKIYVTFLQKLPFKWPSEPDLNEIIEIKLLINCSNGNNIEFIESYCLISRIFKHYFVTLWQDKNNIENVGWQNHNGVFYFESQTIKSNNQEYL